MSVSARPASICFEMCIRDSRGAHPLHQRKGRIALGVGIHRKYHAGVAAGDQQPQRIPGHKLRRNGRACVVHIGKDAGPVSYTHLSSARFGMGEAHI